MANTKISQLPIYTGTAADLRWFVMNNSGETTTYKYSGYSSPFKSVGTTNSNNIYDTNAMGGNFSSIVAGENNTIPSPSGRNFIGGGISNIISGSQDSVILGSYDSIIRAQGRNGIYSSFQSDITQTPNYQCAIIASAYSNIAWGNATAIVGGYSHTINGTNNNRSVIIGGEFNILTSTLDGTILNGFSNTLTSSNQSSIVGGNNNTITNASPSQILGGSGNTITGGTFISMIGCNNKTATQSNTTYVENFNSFGLAQIGSGNTFNDYSGSNLKNALVVGNRNKVDGAANTPVMFIGNDLDTQQFGSYALHIGNGHYASGSYNLSIGDSGIEMNGNYGLIIGHSGGKQAHKSWGTDNYNLGQSNQTQGITGAYTFGKDHTISNGTWNGIFGGVNHTISSSGNYNAFVGGQDSNITGGTNVVMIGTSGRTATTSNATFVENLVVFNYTNLNFANDTAAAAGGVVLGQVYHHNGALRIRIV